MYFIHEPKISSKNSGYILKPSYLTDPTQVIGCLL